MATSESPLRGSTSKNLEVEPLSKLRPNILATLAYYDVFDFPLKAEEVWRNLISFKHLNQSHVIARPLVLRYPQIQEIQKELDQLVLNGSVNSREGCYFLFNREYLVPLRQKREKIAKHKWQITRRAVWWLRFLPYIRAVFASGSLAMRNTDEISDLDVLIIVKHGRIWLTRLLITGLFSFLRVRRDGRDKIAPDKICLNHYITDKSLNIPHKSIYTAQTYANLVPIFVCNRGLLDEFKKANNWVLDYAWHWNINQFQGSTLEFFGHSVWARCGKVLLNNRLGNRLEKLARDYQSRRIVNNPVTRQIGGRVIFTDEQLEFHPRSIETQIINGYNKRLLKLNLPQLAVEKDSGLIPNEAARARSVPLPRTGLTR